MAGILHWSFAQLLPVKERRPFLKMNKYGPLKRGYTRKDGMIFWSYAASAKNNEWWVTSEQFDKLIFNKKKRDEKKTKELKQIKKTLKRGYTREDGMFFWMYNASSKNGEQWVTKDKFEEYKKNQYKRIRKRVDIRVKEDSLFRFTCSIRVLIRRSLETRKYRKKSKTSEILGCSFEQFKSHIENQFLPGMNWENRSQWHLDHIMPVSMAKTYDELLRLNHYKNFRPLWAKDNMVKSDKKIDTLVLF